MRNNMQGVNNYVRRVQHNRERLARDLADFPSKWDDMKQFGDFIASETGGIHVMRCSHQDVKNSISYLKSILDKYETTTKELLDEYEEY